MPTATAAQVGRPQPDTTAEPPGGPFIRHTQPGTAPQYTVTGQSFGQLVQQPLVARSGYYRDMRIFFQSTGGANGGPATVAFTADSVFAIASLVQFRDAFGTLIVSAPSYELKLMNTFAGGAGQGLLTLGDPANLPGSFSAVAGTSNAGNFSWALTLPLEFAKGIGTMPGANASVQPQLVFQLNPTSSVFTTPPTTTPTAMTIAVESDFYWLPSEDAAIEPPNLGTSRQWVLQQAAQSIPANSTSRLAFPRLGGYLDTLILETRDNTGARTTQVWPAAFSTTRMRVYIDGVPIWDTPGWKLVDDMAIVTGGTTIPNGVLVFSRKTSLNQRNEGLLDSGEETLSTNPGTLIEVEVTTGTITNSPAFLNLMIGQIVPRGPLAQGLPEL